MSRRFTGCQIFKFHMLRIFGFTESITYKMLDKMIIENITVPTRKNSFLCQAVFVMYTTLVTIFLYMHIITVNNFSIC